MQFRKFFLITNAVQKPTKKTVALGGDVEDEKLSLQNELEVRNICTFRYSPISG